MLKQVQHDRVIFSISNLKYILCLEFYTVKFMEYINGICI